jgi:hypothetical protein
MKSTVKLATCYFNSFDASTSRDRIFLTVVLLFVVTLLGIAAMKLDDDFKNNISKHTQRPQLLFAGSGAF